MMNLKNLFARALLALMLATGAGAAMAGPVYHVTVDTTGLEGTAMLDFLFLGYESSPEATATLSNFVGDFGSRIYTYGDDVRGDIGSSVVLGSLGGWNEYAQAVNLGGLFRFELAFNVDAAGDAIGLDVALLNDTLDGYIGTEGNIVQFELVAGVPGVIGGDGPLVDVIPVPEPATLASLMFGLALMGSTLRARRK